MVSLNEKFTNIFIYINNINSINKSTSNVILAIGDVLIVF